MANAKHTPGHWKVGKRKDASLADGFEYTIDDSRGHMLFMAAQKGNNAKTLANAKLIAAAPMLLEALQSMLSRFENADKGMIKADHVRAIARDAINKATI